jgi:hypothetical protein
MTHITGKNLVSNTALYVYFFLSFRVYKVSHSTRLNSTNKTFNNETQTTNPMTNFAPYVIVFGVGAMIAYEIIKDERQTKHTPFYDFELTSNLFRMLLGGAALTFVYSQLE